MWVIYCCCYCCFLLKLLLRSLFFFLFCFNVSRCPVFAPVSLQKVLLLICLYLSYNLVQIVNLKISAFYPFWKISINTCFKSCLSINFSILMKYIIFTYHITLFFFLWISVLYPNLLAVFLFSLCYNFLTYHWTFKFNYYVLFLDFYVLLNMRYNWLWLCFIFLQQI